MKEPEQMSSVEAQAELAELDSRLQTLLHDYDEETTEPKDEVPAIELIKHRRSAVKSRLDSLRKG
jgi:hypothetical protein